MQLPASLATTRARLWGGLAAMAAAAALLSACASTDGASTAAPAAGATTAASGGGGLGNFFKPDPNRGVVQVQTEQTLPTEMFLKQGYCPPVQIRPGTEAFVAYERGEEETPDTIRFQASIGQTARECTALGPDTLSIKVGVRGRIAAGPKGGEGGVTVPLRVAVVKQHGGTVLFSQVYPVAVTIAAPQYSADFQQVIEQVNVQLQPTDRDLIVYVGFDSGPPKPTT